MLDTKHLQQFSRHGYCPWLIVLCGSWIKANFRTCEIHTRPAQLESLAKPHPRVVSHRKHRAKMLRQFLAQLLIIGMFEEALARWRFLEHREVRNLAELPIRQSEPEHAPQQS